MARYNRQIIQRNFNGKKVFTTTRYPEIKKRVTDIYVIVTDSDRLDLLAFEYYNNTSLWWIIAQSNNLGKGTLRIESGLQIRIPTDIEPILKEYRRINNA